MNIQHLPILERFGIQCIFNNDQFLIRIFYFRKILTKIIPITITDKTGQSIQNGNTRICPFFQIAPYSFQSCGTNIETKFVITILS